MQSAWPPYKWDDLTVVVAVSGGCDSVALLRALSAVRPRNGQIVVAHFNHQMRGNDSDAHEQFVQGLAEQLGCPFQVGFPPTPLPRREEAARNARYRFLTKLAQQVGARYVAVGHSATDQAETVLHRILRGTGIRGLQGIPRTRELFPGITLIRPLLGFSRSQLLDYLDSIQQPFQDDVTNLKTHFTRNRIRQSLMPLLKTDFNERIESVLERLAKQAAESQSVMEPLAEGLLEEALLDLRRGSQEYGKAVLDCRVLRDQPRHLVREMFLQLWLRNKWPRQAMDLDWWDTLADLAIYTGFRQTAMLPGRVRVHREGDRLTLARQVGGEKPPLDESATNRGGFP